MNSKALVDALRVELMQKADNPASPLFTLPACPHCKSEPNISYGKNAKQFFASHKWNCPKLESFSLVIWGANRETLISNWKESIL